MAAQQPTVIFRFTLVGALHLPKLDMFGKIDAYAIVRNESGTSKAKTKVVDKDYNPRWNQTVLIETPLSSRIMVDVFDSDAVGDDDLACQASFLPSDLVARGELEVEMKSQKAGKGGKPTLQLSFDRSLPLMKAFPTVAAELRAYNVPGHVIDAKNKTVYVPVPNTPFLLGCEFEKKGRVDLKLLAQETSDWLDFVHSGRESIQVDRKYINRKIGDRTYVVEAKLDDITVKDNFSQIVCITSPGRKTGGESMSGIVTKAGWKGRLNYAGARRILKGVLFDDKKEEIFFPIREDKSAFFVCDFDDDKVEFKMVVTPQANRLVYDLKVVNKSLGKEVDKQSRVYNPPKAICQGKVYASRILELDDIPFGSSFGDVEWMEYELVQLNSVPFTSMLSLTL
mmetsp:Transcript_6627/g.18726  ORF Transcript_6627/g.18726 Transcript_6627/m.18726 type:complete len:396 (-) Transcript_6627:168-1355(-)|eukprot:CAMPEP_0119120608 /NCGR_PEP_ID=MMETSP1310-20130426/1574_1 /TAXON_ID=464262 /ORGANISM="Genus nov. species nov., Strain RCC2339" /LENGTH=395 /DNA_ID=CAMNT_0007110095 /DNA_START=42 /DNA_END=1229 /DNA_ORIENTATION=-